MARFGRTERFAHWWTVAMVTVALLSGVSMGDESGSGPMLVVHVASVVLIFAGLVGALVFGDRVALLRAGHTLFVFDRADAAWLRERAHRPIGRHAHDQSGFFNAGQKLLAWMLSVTMIAVIATGIASWSSGGEGGLHGATVVLAAVLLAAHVFMAVLNPATRPALHGMVFGRVRRSWAAQHHAGWLASIDHVASHRRDPQ